MNGSIGRINNSTNMPDAGCQENRFFYCIDGQYYVPYVQNTRLTKINSCSAALKPASNINNILIFILYVSVSYTRNQKPY